MSSHIPSSIDADDFAMDPGHVDFVLHVSENLEQAEANINNAMPISKRLGFGVVALGLLMLFLGTDFLANNSIQTPAALLLKEQAIGVGMIFFGGLLIALVARSFLLFLHEVLELVD